MGRGWQTKKNISVTEWNRNWVEVEPGRETLTRNSDLLSRESNFKGEMTSLVVHSYTSAALYSEPTGRTLGSRDWGPAEGPTRFKHPACYWQCLGCEVLADAGWPVGAAVKNWLLVAQALRHSFLRDAAPTLPLFLHLLGAIDSSLPGSPPDHSSKAPIPAL